MTFAATVEMIGSLSVAVIFEILGPVFAILGAIAIALIATIELMELTGAISPPSGGKFGPGV
ncbi:hypothetical protein DLM75_20310 [Leptospira stimsonii]|uniref:Permease n=1 Tax=Leptospira stimsonii TaxID=2202203 RepID=A0A396YSI8_9LEPT|nr:hypothetical protein DLM75_20310 [Leptospira stimsonii]